MGEKRYYVYVLYILLDGGEEYWLYAGKGSGRRVTSHIPNFRGRLKRGLRLDAKQRLMLMAEDLGYAIQARIIKDKLGENEAFNLEGETIRKCGLLHRGNVAYPHRRKRAA